jgi:hypothetical protein
MGLYTIYTDNIYAILIEIKLIMALGAILIEIKLIMALGAILILIK